ncbi:MAG: helix-turn-helix domain-containing protein, partial [Clostridia bacterium]|nr:helix-turn-helix domain-containing protein [Clostridia bacterium]
MKQCAKESKLEIVNLHKQGVKVNVISAEYGVSRATIYNWLKESKAINKKAKDNVITLANYEKL